MHEDSQSNLHVPHTYHSAGGATHNVDGSSEQNKYKDPKLTSTLTTFQANFNFSFITLAQPMQSVVFGVTVMYACDTLNKGRCE